jgi:hypothetical protein
MMKSITIQDNEHCKITVDFDEEIIIITQGSNWAWC